jgi:hypothetical protein
MYEICITKPFECVDSNDWSVFFDSAAIEFRGGYIEMSSTDLSTDQYQIINNILLLQADNGTSIRVDCSSAYTSRIILSSDTPIKVATMKHAIGLTGGTYIRSRPSDCVRIIASCGRAIF